MAREPGGFGGDGDVGPDGQQEVTEIEYDERPRKGVPKKAGPLATNTKVTKRKQAEKAGYRTKHRSGIAPIHAEYSTKRPSPNSQSPAEIFENALERIGEVEDMIANYQTPLLFAAFHKGLGSLNEPAIQGTRLFTPEAVNMYLDDNFRRYNTLHFPRNHVISEGKPRNPFGRTGVSGKGQHANEGANPIKHVAITFNHPYGVIILLQKSHQESGAWEWILPKDDGSYLGFEVPAGGYKLEARPQSHPMNTDDAWFELQVRCVRLPSFPVPPSNDELRWVPLSGYVPEMTRTNGTHRDLLRERAEEILLHVKI